MLLDLLLGGDGYRCLGDRCSCGCLLNDLLHLLRLGCSGCWLRLTLLVPAQLVRILALLLLNVVFDALLDVLFELAAFEHGQRVELKLVNFALARLGTRVLDNLKNSGLLGHRELGNRVFECLFLLARHGGVHEVDWFLFDGGGLGLLLVLSLVAELFNLFLQIFD